MITKSITLNILIAIVGFGIGLLLGRFANFTLWNFDIRLYAIPILIMPLLIFSPLALISGLGVVFVDYILQNPNWLQTLDFWKPLVIYGAGILVMIFASFLLRKTKLIWLLIVVGIIAGLIVFGIETGIAIIDDTVSDVDSTVRQLIGANGIEFLITIPTLLTGYWALRKFKVLK